jgi:hypothetical protein
MALSASCNQSASFLPGRIKQWGKMNHLYAGGTFYHAIKTLQRTEDIVACLEAWADGRP